MGFREVVLVGFVLLVSGGSRCAAAQDQFSSSANESRAQIPREGPKSPGATGHQSNRTEGGDPVRFPFSYRLKALQLGKPAVAEQKREPPSHGSEAAKQTSGQLNPGETVRAQELKSLIPGPDLNPPVEPEPQVAVALEQRAPAPAISVAARCGEGEVTVEVKQSLLGNGQLIRPSDLTLGGCEALHVADRVLHFRAALQGCGSTLTMTDEALVYSFSLTYSPTPVGSTAILRTNPAQVPVECRYQRRHYVSSGAARPTWAPFASSVLAEQQLHFSLRLMTEDWRSQRPSGVYFLSDVMRVEAAVLQGGHVPLRVFVDSCVATVGPDPDARPRYAFIDNHGCLSDAKRTGAKSLFMQRSQEDKLQFQLRAFRFNQSRGNPLYITCRLTATTASVPVDAQHKACSFLAEANRWVASGGDNEVCSCCEAGCGERRRRRRLAPDEDVWWEGTAALGPILLEEEEEEEEEEELLPDPAPLLQNRDETGAAPSPPPVALLCGLGAAATAVLFFAGGVVLGGRHKRTGHAVCT